MKEKLELSVRLRFEEESEKLLTLDDNNAWRYVERDDSKLRLCGDGEDFRRDHGPTVSARHSKDRRRKLLQLHAAIAVREMAVPPGNRLEALKANRDGQYSVRVNDQWRICFRWHGSDAYDVEIVDYH